MIYKIRSMTLLSSFLMTIVMHNLIIVLAKNMNKMQPGVDTEIPDLLNPITSSNVPSNLAEKQEEIDHNPNDDVELLAPVDIEDLKEQMEETHSSFLAGIDPLPSKIANANAQRSEIDDVEVEVICLNVADRKHYIHKEVIHFLGGMAIILILSIAIAFIYNRSKKSLQDLPLKEMQEFLITNNNRDYWAQII